MAADPIAVVLKFEQLINSGSAEKICGLLTEDSLFIDSLGNQLQGIDKLRQAWERYFRMVPDYAISHSEIFGHGQTVAVFGSARGTFSKGGATKKEDFWTTPAAWRALVKDGKIAMWQVFADNEPIRRIMLKYQAR